MTETGAGNVCTSGGGGPLGTGGGSIMRSGGAGTVVGAGLDRDNGPGLAHASSATAAATQSSQRIEERTDGRTIEGGDRRADGRREAGWPAHIICGGHAARESARHLAARAGGP